MVLIKVIPANSNFLTELFRETNIHYVWLTLLLNVFNNSVPGNP